MDARAIWNIDRKKKEIGEKQSIWQHLLPNAKKEIASEYLIEEKYLIVFALYTQR